MARGKREHSEQRGSTEGTSGKLTERGDEDVSAMAVLCCAMLCYAVLYELCEGAVVECAVFDGEVKMKLSLYYTVLYCTAPYIIASAPRPWSRSYYILSI